MRDLIRGLALPAAALCLAACASTAGGQGTGDDDTSSDAARQIFADGSPFLVDADPFAPDADPLAPDARPISHVVDAGVVVSPDADTGLRGWQPIGGAIPSTYSFPSLALTIDGNGQPVIAVPAQTATTSGIDVLHLAAGQWARLGTQIDTTGMATTPNITAFGQTFYLAYPSTGNRNAVRQWNGTTWLTPANTPLGVSSTNLPYADVAVDDGGKPWVTFTEHAPAQSVEKVYVRSQAADGSWTDRGGPIDESSAPNQSVLAPDIASGGGQMYIAFEGPGVFARKWNAAMNRWDELPAVTPSTAGYQFPSTCGLAVDGQGRPVVGYHAYIGGNDGTNVFVSRYENGAWVQLGGPLQGYVGAVSGQATYATFQDVATTATGIVYVVWTETNASNTSGVYVDKCVEGSGCVPVGRGRLDVAAGDANVARVAIDGAGRPVVAWVEATTVGGALVVHVWHYLGDPDPGAP